MTLSICVDFCYDGEDINCIGGFAYAKKRLASCNRYGH